MACSGKKSIFAHQLTVYTYDEDSFIEKDGCHDVDGSSSVIHPRRQCCSWPV